MKALSIRQPWDWLIIHGYKDVENRTWATAYRGELLIHAAKTFESKNNKLLLSKLPDLAGEMPTKKEDFYLGGVIGKVTLVDCTKKYESFWFTGPYGWVLENPTPLPFVPYRGEQRLFEIDASLFNQV